MLKDVVSIQLVWKIRALYVCRLSASHTPSKKLMGCRWGPARGEMGNGFQVQVTVNRQIKSNPMSCSRGRNWGTVSGPGKANTASRGRGKNLNAHLSAWSQGVICACLHCWGSYGRLPFMRLCWHRRCDFNCAFLFVFELHYPFKCKWSIGLCYNDKWGQKVIQVSHLRVLFMQLGNRARGKYEWKIRVR